MAQEGTSGVRFDIRRIALLALAAGAITLNPSSPLEAQKADVSEKQVVSILQRCFQCHGESLKMANLDLRTRDSMLKGGENGAAIVPGKAEASLLYKRVSGAQPPAMPMPPVQALNAQEIAILKDWIDQGAKWSPAATSAAPATSAAYGSSYKEPHIPDSARQWWAFRPPVRSALPEASDPRWNRNPIDAFIRSMMDRKGLVAAPQADRRTLIRRAYLDLVGLLPPPDEVEAFVNDPSPKAYDGLIDRLLASPHYGERWGRHWLDVVRYADSSGFEYDMNIDNAWRYRDFVIRAFNQDKPYDRFIVEQLAGDELDRPDFDSLTATTFYRIGPRVRFREKNYPSYRYDYMDDIIRTTYQGFMGLSVNCARCHDHKFDPITRMDYYRSVAAFWGYVDYDQPLAPKDEIAAYEKMTHQLEQEIVPLRAEIARIEAPYREKQRQRQIEDALKKYPEDIRNALQTPEAQRTPGQKLLVSQVLINPEDVNPDVIAVDINASRRLKAKAKADAVFGISSGNKYVRNSLKLSDADEARRDALRAQIDEIEDRLPPPLPVADGVRDGDYRLSPDGLGDSHIPGTGRPNYDVKCCFIPQQGRKFEVPPLYFGATGDDIKADERTFQVQPGFLQVLSNGTQTFAAHPPNRTDYVSSGRRRALAEWIASKDNPLTARVMINRIWGWHFGTGLVATPGNFGKMGKAPSHPELLDWLATEFVRQGWSMKQMHRLIMTSETYKMASSFFQPADSEKDPTNVYLWKFPMRRLEAEIIRDATLSASGAINLAAGGEPFFPPIPVSVRAAQPRGIWELTKEGPDTWRRSVYAYRKRGLKYPLFDVYDEPDLNVTCERRSVSTVPTQALTMLNNDFLLIQADHFAERVRKEAGKNPEAQVQALYRIALSREPNPKELASSLAFLQKERIYDAGLLAGAEEDQIDLAALSGLAHVILNLNEFMYIR